MTNIKEVTISNDVVQATISAQAAEITSFKRKDNNIEMIWNKNPEYWTNCNPILFPYTGPLKEGKYSYQGNTYELGQHGFARHALFEFEEQQDDYAKLSLTYSDATLAVYPFKFKLTVEYKLVEAKININYTVTNLDEQELPFSIGFHPAFNCPMTSDSTYQDYRIEFEQVENLCTEGHEIPSGDSFKLEGNLVKGSFFYRNNQIKSNWVQLTDDKHTIRVGCENYSTLGFWKKTPDTPFICIEPWHPNNDLEKVAFFRDDTLNNLLPVGQSFNCDYYFEIIK